MDDVGRVGLDVAGDGWLGTRPSRRHHWWHRRRGVAVAAQERLGRFHTNGLAQ